MFGLSCAVKLSKPNLKKKKEKKRLLPNRREKKNERKMQVVVYVLMFMSITQPVKYCERFVCLGIPFHVEAQLPSVSTASLQVYYPSEGPSETLTQLTIPQYK